MRVLAVAESDSYVKWAAWTLETIADEVGQVDLVAVRTAVGASPGQRGLGVVGTRWEERGVASLSMINVARRLRADRPDVVLLACTGPTVAMLSSICRLLVPTSVIASGMPGIALPVRDRAIAARRLVDVLIVHSLTERRAFEQASADSEAAVVGLATLPFLSGESSEPNRKSTSEGPLLFAAQPSVPPARDQRRELLVKLAGRGPPPPMVKLRTVDGLGIVTHDEPHPYPELFHELVAEGVVAADALTFVDGPMRAHLADTAGLVTVSSTAALEAISSGVPVLVVDDFGVDDHLINSVFRNSGLLGSVEVDDPRSPDPEWCRENYFHDAERNDLVDVLARVHGSGRRAGLGMGIDSAFARSWSRGALRVLAGLRTR